MRVLKLAGIATSALLIGLAGWAVLSSTATERDISAFQGRIVELGATALPPAYDEAEIGDLPEPVQRYFAFTFRGPVPAHSVVRLHAEGEFRRPLTETFRPMTAEQVIAIGEPALMFSGTTSVLPGVWARAYDFFAEGEMEMKAKILSTLTVVDEKETSELNRISLRRWLLESALFPQALLPGGPVAWEAVDENSARVVVEADGLRASMVAHFDADGRMTRMTAEQDGDLTTPYHGSGEHVTRDDYQRVANQMIPMRFTVSRAAGGAIHPFFSGHVTDIAFELVP
ncbi:MAG: DUF6544 family protein [Geminicoccaceae bacterium]